MISEEILDDLTNKMAQNRSCLFKLVWITLLPSLFLVPFIIAYLGFIPFQVDLVSLVFMSLSLLIYSFLAQESAYYASCKFRANFTLIKSDFIEYINKNSLEVKGTTKSNKNIEDFLQKVTHTLRNENFSSIAVVLLSIITLFAVMFTLGLSIKEFDVSHIYRAALDALSIFLYTLFLIMLWIVFEKSGSTLFQKDVDFFTTSTEELFWQKGELEQIYLEESSKNFEQLNKSLENILNKQMQLAYSMDQIVEKKEELCVKDESDTPLVKRLEDDLKDVDQETAELIAKFEKLKNGE